MELRVDLDRVQGLSEDARERLRALAEGRLDAEGRLLVVSQRTRDQHRNLEDAREKVRALVRRALDPAAAAAAHPRHRRRPRRPAGRQAARAATRKRTRGAVRGRGLTAPATGSGPGCRAARAAMTPRMPWTPCSNCSFVHGFFVVGEHRVAHDAVIRLELRDQEARS